MKCTSCQAALPDPAPRFCDACGMAVPRLPPRNQLQTKGPPPTEAECGECGRKVKSRVCVCGARVKLPEGFDPDAATPSSAWKHRPKP